VALIDVLSPNDFSPTGETVPLLEAWRRGLWVPTFNLWIVQRDAAGQPYVLYQLRGEGRWAAGFLDVAVGGHYEVGERGLDGLREAEEELGKRYAPSDVTFLGRKLYLLDEGDRHLRSVVDVYIVQDDSPLETFRLQEAELTALYRLPLRDLIDLHEERIESFDAEGISITDGVHQHDRVEVTRAKFPYNWDHYHRKMAYICRRFLDGDEPLVY
jgi:NUDIX domain